MSIVATKTNHKFYVNIVTELWNCWDAYEMTNYHSWRNNSLEITTTGKTYREKVAMAKIQRIYIEEE